MDIKVLSLAQWDWAGCGYFLSEAVNQCTPHHSRASRTEQSTLKFPHDMEVLSGKNLRSLWKWADVVHVHDAMGYNKIKLPPKPTVITYHGTRYRIDPDYYHRMDKERGWVGSVATADLTMFGLPLLPDCRPDLSQYVCPDDEFTVIHAPTKRDVKGTESIIEACKKLNVKLDLIEHAPWEECMQRKGKGHLLIDQFELGYGCNAIEAWSMGIPVIANGTPDIILAMDECFSPLPFLRPVDGLAETIDRLKWDGELHCLWSDVGHEHYKQWHSPEAAAEIAANLYRQAVGNGD